MITRRNSLQLLAATAASSALPLQAGTNKKFAIGACDWTLRKQQDIAAFDVATEIGLEGLQISFSTPDSAFDLRDPKVREQYYRKVDETGIQLASLGMGILNKMPLASHPEAIDWVSDAIDTMAAMNEEQPDKATNICLLAFFGKGDINGKPELMDSVIQKLKTVVKKAEDANVVLGIESLLSADDHLKIIDGIGSKAIQVYYDSANSLKMEYDIYEEVVQLGADRICQVHCKENKGLIGEGDVDFKKFQSALTEAEYENWLIIEGSLPKGSELVESYTKNFNTLDRVFRK